MSDSEYTEEEEEEFRDDMRVFLRLRPINKLEQSRRSKNCIELHEDPTLVTVDSPLEGEYDYTFDHVFEEYATQEEVFEHAVADVPHSLMEGYNCTVIAYGQTGTGKTHSMLGINGGSDGLLNKTKMIGKSMASVGPEFDEATRDAGNTMSKTMDSKTMDSKSNVSGNFVDELEPDTEGMIPRTISSVFRLMKKATATTEFTIRCSYVEIYLEKVLDLLHPQGTTSITIQEEAQADKAAGPSGTPAGVRIKGASELCCLDEGDVCALLTRGNACRTMSSTEMNTESSRSHAIFVLRLEQTDRLTNSTKTSILHMVDLAGSELASKDPSKRKSMAASQSAVQTEALMINKSLNALNKMIRAQLAHQQGERNIPLDSIARQSKLTRLLRPSFGGNCLTTLILTASPSSYNIGETISTINFGQRCRRIYNDPNIIESEPVDVYKKKLQEFMTNYEDAMGLARALGSECLRMRDGESSGEGPLWDTIEHLGSKADPPPDFKVTIKRKKLKLEGDDDGSDEEEEVSYFANERVKLEDEIEGLKEENEYLTRQRQDADSHLAELQSEVAVLRTQNENLTIEKQRNIEELVNAKNEVQSLSQRKLEVEHNLRTSQFRENEVIVFLRQFRRFYRNVLKDKAAHGAGSIQAITAEVTDKVPNAPNLNDLRDVDCLLVESGILEDYEMGEDKASGSYIPSRDALMRSAGAAQRAAAAEAEISKDNFDSSDDDDDQYIAQTITRVAGPLRLPGPGVQMDTITELNASAEVKPDESDDESDDGIEGARRAGADAGAGMIAMDDRSFLSSDTGSMAHSISRPIAAGLMVTRKQRILNTPSGRLTVMREKDLEKELLEMSERCIDLQMALNEEKAVVDALTNKSGGLSKKRLAQEAISLRQQLEKKTASLTAIAWKMNELNLINKTYNEKMASREQHVLYLEEQFVELQNNNRRLIVDRGESEKKLRDEIENLHSIVGGMTVPLWQFGEKNIVDKPLATRVIITAVGGDPESPFEFDPFKRRRSVGNEEPDMEFPTIPDVPLYDDSGDSRDDASTDPDEDLLQALPGPPKRPKRRTSDKLRMSVNKLRAARMLMRNMEKSGDNLDHAGESTMEDALAMVASQVNEDTSRPVSRSRSLELSGAPESIPVPVSAPMSPPVQLSDAGTQTMDEEAAVKEVVVKEVEVKESMQVQTQTEEVQVYDLDVSVTLDSDKPETYGVVTQTDEVQVFDIDIPMIEDYEKEMYDADVQTDEVQVFDIDIPMVEDYEKEMYDADMQTDDVQVFDIDIPMVEDYEKETFDANVQTDEKEMFDADVQTDEVQVYDVDVSMIEGYEKELFDADVQTDDVQVYDANKPMIEGYEKDLTDANVQTDEKEAFDADVQTDDVQVYDIGISMIEGYEKELHDADVQTDEKEVFHADVQTDEVQVFDVDIPMIEDYEKEMYDADAQTDEVQVFDFETAMVPSREEVEKFEFGVQTDDEPLTQVFERNLQTDDVEFVVAVDKDDAFAQTDEVILAEADAQTDELDVDHAFCQSDDIATQATGTMTSEAMKEIIDGNDIGTTTDSQEEAALPAIGKSQALAAIDRGVVAEEAVSTDHRSNDAHLEDDDDSEVDSSHNQDYDEDSVEEDTEKRYRSDDRYLEEDIQREDDSSQGMESDEDSDEDSVENRQRSDDRYPEQAELENDSSQDKDYDEDSVEDSNNRYPAADAPNRYSREDGEEDFSQEDDSSEDEFDEESYGENAGNGYSPVNKSNSSRGQARGEFLDATEDEQKQRQLGRAAEVEGFGSEDESDSRGSVKNDLVDVQNGGGNSEEGNDDDIERLGNESEEYAREDMSDRNRDGEESSEGDENDASEFEDEDESAEEIDAMKEDYDADEPQESTAIGRSTFLSRQNSSGKDTKPRSRDLSPVNRFMPEADKSSQRASNRFMPAEEGLSSSRRLASRRFLVNENAEPGKNDNLRLSSAASSRRVTTIPLLEQAASEKLLLDAANKDDIGYDDLGTRWGMTDDEIAADAAVLTTPRRDSNGVLSIDNDEIDALEIAADTEKVAAAAEPDVLDDESSEDGFERDLFDNDFDVLKKSHHSTSTTGPPKESSRGLQEQVDSMSDNDEAAGDSVSKHSLDSSNSDDDDNDDAVHDDDFDKMMTEAAAALAAADELMGDDNEEVSAHEEEEDDQTFYDDIDNTSDQDEYVSEEPDSDDNDVEYRSAQDHRFSVNEDASRDDSEERTSSPESPDPTMFEGGKSVDYELRRFTVKKGKSIKPATMKGGHRKVDDETGDDEGSIISTGENDDREAPQLSPLQSQATLQEPGEPEPESTNSARSSLMDKGSTTSSSKRRDEDKRRRKKKSSSRSPSRHGRRGDGKERRSRRENEEGSESKDRRSRRDVADEGGGVSKHRRSRREEADESGDGEEGESMERERRSRRSKDEESGDGKEGESKDRRSRRSKDEESGGERRHRSRREVGGESRGHRSTRGVAGERHKSSRRLVEGSSGDTSRRVKSSSRLDGGGDTSRRARSSRHLDGGGDTSRRIKSSRRLGEGDRKSRSHRRHRSDDGSVPDGTIPEEAEDDSEQRRSEEKRRKKKSSRHH